MRICYFDCYAGISGDMILGALVDAGADLKKIAAELKKIKVGGYSLSAQKVTRATIGGTQVIVRTEAHHGHGRKYSEIKKTIQASRLAPSIQEKILDIFATLARAEAGVHRTSLENIHFHELGSVDTIVDIAGAVIGLDLLGVDKVCCSPLNLGAGVVKTMVGVLPAPGPATLEILKGKQVYSSGPWGELVTPTGAAIVKTLAKEFTAMPGMSPERVGYGAGTRILEGMANYLRVVIGESGAGRGSYDTDQVLVLETQVDDLSPQIYDHVLEKLFQAGALDVTMAAVQMKKNRPGVLVTVLAPQGRENHLLEILFQETTTVGIRAHLASRYKLFRRFEKVKTRYGMVQVKVSGTRSRVLTVTPEYEECKKIASQRGVPLRRVLEEVREKAKNLVK